MTNAETTPAVSASGISLRLTARSTARRMNPGVGAIGLTGLLTTGLLVSLSAAHTRLLLPASVALGLPEWLRGPLGDLGPNLHIVGLIVVLSAMFACYVVVLRFRRQLPGKVIAACAAVLFTLLLLTPPLLSTDMFSYGAYARMGVLYGIDPYQYGPAAIRFDSWYPLIGSQWVATPSAYGPLFTMLSYLLARQSVPSSVLAYKGMAMASGVFVVFAVGRLARRRGLDPSRAVILVGLNPVLLVWTIGGGHNDLLMLALLTGAIWAFSAHRAGCAGALLVAAASIKLTAGLLLPFALAAQLGERPALRRLRLLGGATAMAVVMSVASLTILHASPLRLLDTLAAIQTRGGTESIPGFIAAAVGLGRLSGIATASLVASFVVMVVWLLARVRRGRLDWITASGWAIVALLTTSAFLVPWYTVWLLPLAALSDDKRLLTATVFLSAVGLTSL